MLAPETSDLFTEWVDPNTGVSSYLLNRNEGRWSMGFYPVTDPSTTDQRFLWVKLLEPPSPSETLAVIDFERDELIVHGETAKSFLSGDGYVDPDSGRLYWPTKTAIFSKRPRSSQVEVIGRVDRRAVGGEQVNAICKVLDRSPDGNWLSLNISSHDKYHIGRMEIETGDVEVWATFDRHYTYPQFDPDNSDRLMFAQDNYTDPITGEYVPYDDRIWMIEKGGEPTTVFDDDIKRNHQIWDPNGDGIWYQVSIGDDPNDDWVVNYDPNDEETIVKWRKNVTHFDVSATEDLVAFDTKADDYGSANTDIGIYRIPDDESRLIGENRPNPTYWAARYDPDPHPKFVLNDSYVMHTARVRDGLDLALTPVDSVF